MSWWSALLSRFAAVHSSALLLQPVSRSSSSCAAGRVWSLLQAMAHAAFCNLSLMLLRLLLLLLLLLLLAPLQRCCRSQQPSAHAKLLPPC
jgi:hypothetical protein